MNYKESGVDVEAGNQFVEHIKKFTSVGNFSANIKIGRKNVFTTCDGVGTKLLVAKYLNKYDTIGIDLVAMSVNDLLASGATPLSFMDYIACGKITDTLKEVMKGIIAGCDLAECNLVGGETAEMPDMYDVDDIDLAGFAVGIAKRRLPIKNIKRGDILLGLPSSGIHSNGLTLARKVIEKELWLELLKPTKIYTKEMKNILNKKYVFGAAHITGGGFDNIKRILPSNMNYKLNYKWTVPDIFYFICERSKMFFEESSHIFNLGIGMVIVADRKKAERLHLPVIGEVV